MVSSEIDAMKSELLIESVIMSGLIGDDCKHWQQYTKQQSAITAFIHAKPHAVTSSNPYLNSVQRLPQQGPENSGLDLLNTQRTKHKSHGKRHRTHGEEFYTQTSYHPTQQLNRKLNNKALRMKELLKGSPKLPRTSKMVIGNDRNSPEKHTVNSVLGFEAKNNNREKISLTTARAGSIDKTSSCTVPQTNGWICATTDSYCWTLKLPTVENPTAEFSNNAKQNGVAST
ncbi:hypothetical protein F511_31922 [Dorcoceras hygrometricum]|uniref:Uncharacterized protein n=1 Tax=Dorcoceras hygrometricum TaxID=472368 RepID=A0A2Z7AFP0_9LAMI|nr:hypothetical protein F511_31922 [Dorcoceras hygrometricum]